MTIRPDVLIQGADYRPVAIVEVKNAREFSSEDATGLRQNLLAEGYLVQPPYFLLLSQDVGYLWKQNGRDGAAELPAHEFPMRGVVARYWPDLGATERLRGAELELIVLQWLQDLTLGKQAALQDPERSLAQAGFLAAIRDATILVEDEQ